MLSGGRLAEGLRAAPNLGLYTSIINHWSATKISGVVSSRSRPWTANSTMRSLAAFAGQSRAGGVMGVARAGRSANLVDRLTNRICNPPGGRRTMASGPPPISARDPKYNFAPPKISKPHKLAAEGIFLVMWLWVFYRTKVDGPTLFLGQHPWDHPVEVSDYEYYGLEDPESKSIEYEKSGVGAIPTVVCNDS